MADESQVVVADVPATEKLTTVKETTPVPEVDEPIKAKVATIEEAVETEKLKPGEEKMISQSVSFKEESNIVADLPDPEKKALEELKELIQIALNNHEFTSPPSPPAPLEENPAKEEKSVEEKVEEKPVDVSESSKDKIVAESTPPEKSNEENLTLAPETETETVAVVVETVTAVEDDGAKTVEAIEETIVAVSVPVPAEETSEAIKAGKEAPAPTESKEEEEAIAAAVTPPEEMFIWGIPILGDEKSDVILLKFLRARDFKVKDAFTMIKNTVRWRKEFGADTLSEEDLGNDLDKVVFMQGFDKEGHPVCYNVYGEFQNKDLYQKTFSDEEKRQKFLRWRIQFLEKSISKLDFNPSGICTVLQITDLKNSPVAVKRELRQVTKQALSLVQDNYPEFVAKQIFINVPWWYLAFNRMISPFLTQRTKSKFVFAGPSKSAETLFKYIAPEQVPVQYGGLSNEDNQEFTTTDPVTEITIKPASKQTVEFPISEACLLVWEIRVVGWDVSYGSEFVPNAEDGYTVIIEKVRKMISIDEPVICNNFKIGEPGKVVLTIDNPSSKKKKLLYRSKTKPSSD